MGNVVSQWVFFCLFFKIQTIYLLMWPKISVCQLWTEHGSPMAAPYQTIGSYVPVYLQRVPVARQCPKCVIRGLVLQPDTERSEVRKMKSVHCSNCL